MKDKSTSSEIRQWNYHDLMLHRIHEILLVASPYDAYILEEDGRLTEQILTEYLGMNLSYAPRVWRASTAARAMEMLSKRRYGLVITMLRISDMDPFSFGSQVKRKYPRIPIILLVYDSSELSYIKEEIHKSDIDKIFVWGGNAGVFPAIIKYIEDMKNVKRDVKKGDVRAIIVVEDNPAYYSRILPRIYSQIVQQTRALIDKSLNDAHRLLRLRARPKILLASSYEEAEKYFKKYHNNLLGIISDIRFPRKGELDANAGFKLAEWVRSIDPSVPILLQSTKDYLEEKANKLNVSFLSKKSKTLLQELSEFILNNFGFGDFEFRLPNGKVVAKASDLRELQMRLKTVPKKSIIYHAGKNHFSNWLAARGEFWMASKVRRVQTSDFENIEELRDFLIKAVDTTRQVRTAGRIVKYTGGPILSSATLIRVRNGSLGGKARGLAFANSMIGSSGLKEKFPEIIIRIPRVVVIGTDEFDDFMKKSDLWKFALEENDFRKIRQRFVQGNLSKKLKYFLKAFLKDVKYPIAIRSSGLLEDMQYQSLAGMYATYMLPNSSGSVKERIELLEQAIKLVFASMFSQEVKATIESSTHRLEEEKMAVIIQELVGQRFNNRFYPTFSGVAKNLNYYPVSYMNRAEGVVYVALGLGRTIAEGGKVLRISPKYPDILSQFYSTDAMLESSQNEFYALDMTKEQNLLKEGEENNLKIYSLADAESDGVLLHVGSVVTPEGIVRDSLSYPGVRIVTFARILKMKIFPLAELVQELLVIGNRELGCPVELEFACILNSNKTEKSEFSLLQIRPMASENYNRSYRIEEVKNDELICKSSIALGNGILNEIQNIICIKIDSFDISKSKEIANQIGELNSTFSKKQKYLLIGPGRWGTADSWLGIPVKWRQISKVKVIVEIGTKDLKPDPSFGSHFFQNVTSFRVGYLTVGYRSRNDFVDWNWLNVQKASHETKYIKLIKLDKPISVWIDGQTGQSIIIKPEFVDSVTHKSEVS